MQHFHVPARLRKRLRAPLGRLLKRGTPTHVLRSQLAAAKLLVTVGDAVTDRLLRLGIAPAIQVVDGREKRRRRGLPKGAVAHELHFRNPAGSLSEEAFTQLAQAFGAPKPVRLIVEGEEDLLTLIVLACYPDGTLVVYGQPDEGLVLVRVRPTSRRGALVFLRGMGVPGAVLQRVPRNR